MIDSTLLTFHGTKELYPQSFSFAKNTCEISKKNSYKWINEGNITNFHSKQKVYTMV